jgi:amino acid transporter
MTPSPTPQTRLRSCLVNDTPSVTRRLPRVLGPLAATAVVVGTVIGSGVFRKPSTIADAVPYSGVVALLWIAGGLLVLLGALAYSEVNVLFPQAGGNYVFLRESYGRLFGFLWGWVDFWIIRSGSIAALATVFTDSLSDVISNPALRHAVGMPEWVQLGFWTQRLITVAILAGLAAVNVRGARWGGGLQVFITLVKVGTLLAIAVLPFIVLLSGGGDPPPSFQNVRPLLPASWRDVSLAGVSTAMLGILWAYHGWMNLAPIAEEVREPQRNLPLALLGGVVVIVAVYLGANLAYYLSLSGPEMAEMAQEHYQSRTDVPKTVAAAAALRLMGSLGIAAASAAIMCSVFGALNGNLLVGPRLLYAMSEDGLAPIWLSALHARYRTPALAIVVLASWSILMVLSVAVLTTVPLWPARAEEGWKLVVLLAPGKPHFDRLTDFAMFGAIIFETMAVTSVFVFRWKLPDAPRAFRCPGYPVVPALYVVVPAFVLYFMFQEQPAEALTGLGFIGLGALLFFALGLQKSRTPIQASVGGIEWKQPHAEGDGVQKTAGEIRPAPSPDVTK